MPISSTSTADAKTSPTWCWQPPREWRVAPGQDLTFLSGCLAVKGRHYDTYRVSCIMLYTYISYIMTHPYIKTIQKKYGIFTYHHISIPQDEAIVLHPHLQDCACQGANPSQQDPPWSRAARHGAPDEEHFMRFCLSTLGNAYNSKRTQGFGLLLRKKNCKPTTDIYWLHLHRCWPLTQSCVFESTPQSFSSFLRLSTFVTKSQSKQSSESVSKTSPNNQNIKHTKLFKLLRH